MPGIKAWQALEVQTESIEIKEADKMHTLEKTSCTVYTRVNVQR